MDESGISLGFDLDDLNTLISDEFLQGLTDMEAHNYYEIRSRPAPLSESPSFKTEVVKSRTQFKQQLMRDQLQKEKERKKIILEKEEEKSVRTNNKLPISLQNVTLPQTVLHVKTGLENPTKYHIIEKQKHQVLQYLSTSQQDDSLLNRKNIPQSPQVQQIQQVIPKPSASYSVQAPAPSPSVMSVTSGGASDAEDVLEGILSFEDTEVDSHTYSLRGSNASLERIRDNNSCPSAMATLKQETYLGSSDNAKDRIKKDTHNMIERRRRYNINDRIKELGELLPHRNEPHYDMVRDARSNKGAILKSSVDYIKALRKDVNKIEAMEHENKKLHTTVNKLLLKIQQLENQVRASGATLTEETWRVKAASEIIEHYIKPGPKPRVDMPDLVSEVAYVQYDESMEDVPLPDPMFGAAGAMISMQARDVDME